MRSDARKRCATLETIEGVQYGQLVDPTKVVVIDPNDPDQVVAFAQEVGRNPHVVKAALGRRLAASQSPAEPKGLGAVVRDDEGDVLVRYSASPFNSEPWRLATGERAGTRFAWDDLTVVEVLGEGVVL